MRAIQEIYGVSDNRTLWPPAVETRLLQQTQTPHLLTYSRIRFADWSPCKALLTSMLVRCLRRLSVYD